MRCVYQYWSKRRGRLVHCGKPATLNEDHIALCHEHKEFVEDAAKIPKRLQKRHKTEEEWYRAMISAWGASAE